METKYRMEEGGPGRAKSKPQEPEERKKHWFKTEKWKQNNTSKYRRKLVGSKHIFFKNKNLIFKCPTRFWYQAYSISVGNTAPVWCMKDCYEHNLWWSKILDFQSYSEQKDYFLPISVMFDSRKEEPLEAFRSFILQQWSLHEGMDAAVNRKGDDWHTRATSNLPQDYFFIDVFPVWKRWSNINLSFFNGTLVTIQLLSLIGITPAWQTVNIHKLGRSTQRIHGMETTTPFLR